jgi:HSP20 family protein
MLTIIDSDFIYRERLGDRKERKMEVRITNSNRNAVTQTGHFPISPFRIFEEFFNDWAMSRLGADRDGESWNPPMDVLEEDGNLILRLQVPGVGEKDINLKLEGSTITISGEKKSPDEVKDATYRQSEISYGSFSRTFTLPETVEADKISASFKNGILTVTMPGRAEIKPRTIRINKQ